MKNDLFYVNKNNSLLSLKLSNKNKTIDRYNVIKKVLNIKCFPRRTVFNILNTKIYRCCYSNEWHFRHPLRQKAFIILLLLVFIKFNNIFCLNNRSVNLCFE